METRNQIRGLADALRRVHRALLASLQVGFEKLHGRVSGPGGLLQLAIHDPLFTWLSPMSGQIVALDELAESDSPSLAEAKALVSRLLDAPSDFRASYLACLQADPDVVIAHAAVREKLR
jgi:hypothetical protein